MKNTRGSGEPIDVTEYDPRSLIWARKVAEELGLASRAPRRRLSRRGRIPAHAPYVSCRSVRPNAPPGGAATLASVLHTEDLTVRFGGLPILNRVNFEASSETKGLAFDVIAPLTR